MLGVDKKFTEKDLKKAYRKKAIKVHPDKNNAPIADEAFKKINAAMECLSNPSKRRVYDQVGNEKAYNERQSNSGGGGGGGFGHHGFGGGDFVSPEDIFNHFFFGAEIPRGGRRPQQRQQR